MRQCLATALEEAQDEEWLASRLLASYSVARAGTYSTIFQVTILLSAVSFAIGAIWAGFRL